MSNLLSTTLPSVELLLIECVSTYVDRTLWSTEVRTEPLNEKFTETTTNERRDL